MRSLRLIAPLFVLLEGAFWAPSFILAHSGDVFLARLRTDHPPEVTLEITADVAAHPQLREASNPVEKMGQSLRVLLPSGRAWTLYELGKPTVSLHDGFAAPAPVPAQHPTGEPTPELITASWTWRPSESPLRFEVPKDNPGTVLFWSTQPGSDAVATGWGMLLAGDRSAPQKLPLEPSLIQWNWKAVTGLCIAGLGLTLQAILLLKALRRLRHKGQKTESLPQP